MKHLIIITTCERSHILIENLKKFNFKKNLEFLIFQDGEFDYSNCINFLKRKKVCFTWYKWGAKHGKKKFWSVHNEIYKIIKTKTFNLAHHIQDDCFITPNYFSNIERIFKALPELEVLNTLAVNSHNSRFYRSQFFSQIGKIKIYKLNKLDCNYVAKKSFFKRLNFEVLEIDENFDFKNGSGVGSTTTIRTIANGGEIYNTLPSLLEHVGFHSVIGNKLSKNQITSIL